LLDDCEFFAFLLDAVEFSESWTFCFFAERPEFLLGGCGVFRKLDGREFFAFLLDSVGVPSKKAKNTRPPGFGKPWTVAGFSQQAVESLLFALWTNCSGLSLLINAYMTYGCKNRTIHTCLQQWGSAGRQKDGNDIVLDDQSSHTILPFKSITVIPSNFDIGLVSSCLNFVPDRFPIFALIPEYIEHFSLLRTSHF
jgi:hypothetical protein